LARYPPTERGLMTLVGARMAEKGTIRAPAVIREAATVLCDPRPVWEGNRRPRKRENPVGVTHHGKGRAWLRR